MDSDNNESEVEVVCSNCGSIVCSECSCCCNPSCEMCSCPSIKQEDKLFKDKF